MVAQAATEKIKYNERGEGGEETNKDISQIVSLLITLHLNFWKGSPEGGWERETCENDS